MSGIPEALIRISRALARPDDDSRRGAGRDHLRLRERDVRQLFEDWNRMDEAMRDRYMADQRRPRSAREIVKGQRISIAARQRRERVWKVLGKQMLEGKLIIPPDTSQMMLELQGYRYPRERWSGLPKP